MSLRASWKRTEAHLSNARSELPDDPSPGLEGGTASDFRDYIDHNELELAIDELEGMATSNSTTTQFWFSLHAAAAEMNLELHRDRYSRILATNEPLADYSFDPCSNELQFGDEKVVGFPDQERTCDLCGQKRFYSDEFDAYFCAFCNQWLEASCGDPHCDYCKARSKSPLKTRANKTLDTNT